MALEKVIIPDFGDVQEITVVEVFVTVGDSIEEEASLIALESEKAVMDIPSPFSGVIKEVQVQEEDVVKSGDLIAIIETEAGEEVAVDQGDTAPKEKEEQAEQEVQNAAPDVVTEEQQTAKTSHATPSVRAFARGKGVDLTNIAGTGPKGRILREDVLAELEKSDSIVVASVETAPATVSSAIREDVTKYGDTQEVALSRIQKISGSHLHNSWISIPHVTHFDEADIAELEQFRSELNAKRQDGEVSLSPLVFVVRAVAATLKQFPLFNCSLVADVGSVIIKDFFHIGIAVDTSQGLVVPVIKDADKKGIKEIAKELKQLSSNARAGKLKIGDLQGATFTISSLGGIGGTGFTPIISSPQVAILGLSRSYMKPVWDGEQFQPRLTLPFSVSYDHRVIDGAEAARFCRSLSLNIEDLKRTLL